MIFRLSYDTMSASKNKVIVKYFFFLYNEMNRSYSVQVEAFAAETVRT